MVRGGQKGGQKGGQEGDRKADRKGIGRRTGRLPSPYPPKRLRYSLGWQPAYFLNTREKWLCEEKPR